LVKTKVKNRPTGKAFQTVSHLGTHTLSIDTERQRGERERDRERRKKKETKPKSIIIGKQVS